MEKLKRLRPEIIALTLLAFLTRFWNLFYPKAVVFDEVYFKAFALSYQKGTYYFDIHPPLGKLLLGGFAKLAGVSANLGDNDPAVVMRLLPAFAGALIIPVFYVLLRQLKASRRVATLGATLLLLDNALLVESRFILMDSMLILFTLGSLSAWLAARKRHGKPALAFYSLASVLAGAAYSTKFTGFTAPFLIVCIMLFDYLKRRNLRRQLISAVVLAGLSFLVYVSTFWIHLQLLPKTGPGDAFMSARFQSTLVGNSFYDPKVKMSFAEKFVDLNKALLDSEKSLKGATHPYGSKWYTWPVDLRPVYYWVGGQQGSDYGYIYMGANPLLWWGIIAGAVFVVGNVVAGDEKYRQKKFWLPYFGSLGVLLIGYGANWLPFSRIDRVMFLYHYLIAMCFSLAAVVLALGVLMGWNNDQEAAPWRIKGFKNNHIYFAIVFIVLASFLYFAPISYGSVISDGALKSRMWLQSWR